MPPTKSTDSLFVQSVIGRDKARVWHKMYVEGVPIRHEGRVLNALPSAYYLFDFSIRHVPTSDLLEVRWARYHSPPDLSLSYSKRRARVYAWFVLAYFLSCPPPPTESKQCFLLNINAKEVLGIIPVKK